MDYLLMKKEIFIREIGKTMLKMEQDYLLILTVQNMMDAFRKLNSPSQGKTNIKIIKFKQKNSK